MIPTIRYSQKATLAKDGQNLADSAITCLALSTDGKFLASGGSVDGKVTIWDIEDASPVFDFKGSASAMSLCWMPDSYVAICGYRDGMLVCLELENHTQVCSTTLLSLFKPANLLLHIGFPCRRDEGIFRTDRIHFYSSLGLTFCNGWGGCRCCLESGE
jgi:WD40 repeat protein